MSTHAPEHIDPLARLGRQIVAAAETRAARRHRRRTLLAVSAATLALVAVAGVGAIESDIVGPTPQLAMPGYKQAGDARVDLRASEGLDKPWRLTVYGTESSAICIAAPTSGARSPQVSCRAAFISAEELERTPMTSAAGLIVQSGPDGDSVLVYGLARPDVERVDFEPEHGAVVERSIEGETLEVPTIKPGKDSSQTAPEGTLTVRPFAALFTVPADSKQMHVTVHLADGSLLPYDVDVFPPSVFK